MTPPRPTNEARKGVARLAAMASPRLFLLSVALGALAAVALASCGGDDDDDGTIPPENASAMLQDLDDARGELDELDCDSLGDAAGNLLDEINNLPDTVDPEVRTALVEGAQNLQSQASDESQCEPATTEQTTTEPPTTEETTTEPTTTEETTTTEPEEDKEKPPKEPKPAPEDDDEGEGGGPPVTPPGQGGQPPGQAPPESGGVGGGEDD